MDYVDWRNGGNFDLPHRYFTTMLNELVIQGDSMGVCLLSWCKFLDLLGFTVFEITIVKLGCMCNGQVTWLIFRDMVINPFTGLFFAS